MAYRTAVLFCFLAGISQAKDFYVSPTGSSVGNGSIDNPWDFQSAINHPPVVKPGDTIWVRSGTYGTGRTVFRSWLVGTASAPIIVKQYPGERAIINGWLQLGCCDKDPHPEQGANVWIWGLEFASSIADRTGGADGPPDYGASQILNSVDTWAPGSRLIHNVIHDTRMGISMWKEAVGAEAYGNVIYFNGFQASDRGHGHGFYVQNETGTMSVINNVMFDQFNNGMQFYGSSAAFVRNLLVQGNISFENGGISTGANYGDNVIFANSNGVSGVQLLGNHLYFNPVHSKGYNELGWTDNQDMVAKDNYFIGGFRAIALGDWTSTLFQNNTVYSKDKYLVSSSGTGQLVGSQWSNNRYFGSGLFQNGTQGTNFPGWQSRTGVDQTSTFQANAPTGTWTFVQPSKYEKGRANIVIYNWDSQSSVSVDLSSVVSPGASYEIRDVQNYFGPLVAKGTYTGGSVSIPMTGLTMAIPNGETPVKPTHTAPQFGVFLVQQTPAIPKPVVLGVSSGAGAQTAVQSGSWMSVYGVGLSNTSADASKISANGIPTSLEGVSATVGGKPAYVYLAYPGQLNVIVPDLSEPGIVPVTVNNNGVVSDAGSVRLQRAAPSFFLWGATNYAIATRYPDNAYIANPSAIPGTNSAKPGDILTLWGTGFGATNPVVAPSIPVTGVPLAVNLPSIKVGGIPARVLSTVLSPGSAGLYQVAIEVPASLPDGDAKIEASVDDGTSPASVSLFISNR